MQTQQAQNIYPVSGPEKFPGLSRNRPLVGNRSMQNSVVSRVFKAIETRRVPLDPVARVSRFTPASCFVPLKKGGGRNSACSAS